MRFSPPDRAKVVGRKVGKSSNLPSLARSFLRCELGRKNLYPDTEDYLEKVEMGKQGEGKDDDGSEVFR